jgi:CheY-like chemotaxis protein
MKKILIVEDDDVARELVRMTLERQGYAVETACDGIEGFDLALSGRPDLVVTDIQMPSADGAHLVRRLRDTPETASTPVVITTGDGLRQRRLHALAGRGRLRAQAHRPGLAHQDRAPPSGMTGAFR